MRSMMPLRMAGRKRASMEPPGYSYKYEFSAPFHVDLILAAEAEVDLSVTLGDRKRGYGRSPLGLLQLDAGLYREDRGVSYGLFGELGENSHLSPLPVSNFRD